MSTTSSSTDAAAPVRAPGVKRAGPGEFYFDVGKLDSIMGGPEYSTAYGGCVEGERMMAAVMHMPAGTGSEPHSHPNEQWVYVLQGMMDWTIEGQRQIVNTGELVYVPADAVHHARATADGDVLFFTVKDTSYGLYGRPAR